VDKLSLDSKALLCYNAIMELKKDFFPATTRKQNLAAAKASDNLYNACQLFRALQYANDMGTTEADFKELAEHFTKEELCR
tara:strand:+ start:1240 stop:1482 length:243 start_codon:yes stop_codon:yes gene_type:complete